MTNMLLLKLTFISCLAGENSIDSYKKNGVRKQRSVAKRYSQENKPITLGFTGSRSEDLCIIENCKGNTVLNIFKALRRFSVMSNAIHCKEVFILLILRLDFAGTDLDDIEKRCYKEEIAEETGYFTKSSSEENQSTTFGLIESRTDDLSIRVQLKGENNIFIQQF